MLAAHNADRPPGPAETFPSSNRLAGAARCLALVAVIILFGVYLEWRRAPAIFSQRGVLLVDPDDYMRLVRVRQITDRPGWRVDRLAEINWPMGAELHWTAPMDYLLAAVYRIAGPFVSASDPLAAAAAWAPVALGAAFLAILMFFLRRGCGCPVAAMAAIVAVLSPAFHRVFQMGHPDHHSLLELLFAVAVYVWIPCLKSDGNRAVSSPRAAIVSGAATGLAIWTAPQALFVWGCILAGLVFATFHAAPAERSAWGLRTRAWNAAAFAVVLIGFLLENWPRVNVVAIDRLSLPHLAVVMLGFLLPCGEATRSAAAVLRRRAPKLMAACAVVAAWTWLDRARIFNHLDTPAFLAWSGQIAELQPLFTHADGDWSVKPLLRALGFAPLALPLLLPWFAKSKMMPCGTKLTLMLLSVGFTGLAVVQRRWLDHVTLGLAPVLAVGAWEMARRIGRLLSRESPGVAVAFTVLLLAAICLPSAQSVLFSPRAKPDAQVLRAAIACDRIKDYESSHPAEDPGRRAILSADGDGPMLLYRTGLPIVAAPYHRAIEGVVEVYRFYAERRADAALELLDRLGVQYVMVPFRPHEQLMTFERVAFGELRSFEPTSRTIDDEGNVREMLHYRSEVAATAVYRLAMQPDNALPGLECIARIREGAETTDGLTGLVYVVGGSGSDATPE